MGGKIIGSNGDILFEFEDGQNLEVLLSGLIQRAKFSERFDNDILANDWVNRLLKSLMQAYPDFLKDRDIEADYGAPAHFIDAGMTQKDWDLQDFFYDVTLHLSQSPGFLNQQGWQKMDLMSRQAFLRKVVFPCPISNARLNDLIEDVDSALADAADAYNPKFEISSSKEP